MRRTLTALDRARADLAAAERRAARTGPALEKAREEETGRSYDHAEAKTAVEAYRALVQALGGETGDV